MEIRETKVYKFDELSDEAKEKVIEDHYDINVDYDWWDSVYDDASNVGIKIMEFDIDRGSYCKGKLYASEESVAEAIIKQHGEHYETYKTAEEFLNCVSELDDESDEYAEACESFLYSILEDYRIILEKEYEYLTSEEAIIETIKANEYDFTEDGEIF